MGVKWKPDNICPKCRSAERHPSHGWCRACRNQSTRKHQTKWRYGISHSERDAMIQKQRNRCASCEETIGKEIPRTVNIDHCHKSGTVRGILCSACNTSLGLMKDDPIRIRKLAMYAERHQSPTIPLSISSPPLGEGKK